MRRESDLALFNAISTLEADQQQLLELRHKLGWSFLKSATTRSFRGRGSYALESYCRTIETGARVGCLTKAHTQIQVRIGSLLASSSQEIEQRLDAFWRRTEEQRRMIWR